MKRNNYTKAETGPSIEIICGYDSDRAQWEFEENFEILQHEGYRTHTIAYYIDNGNVKGADSISFEVKGDIQALIKYGRDNYSAFSEITEDDRIELQELKDEILNDLNPKIHNYEEMNDKYDLKDTGLQFVPDRALVRVSIRGYSQGDYAEVIYCPDDLRAAWGSEPNESQLKRMFERYFYDAPIYARADIDGEEYNYYDCPEYDDYEFKRDEFIAWVSKESGASVEALEELVPKTPDYN